MSIDNHRMTCGKRGKNLSQPINFPFTGRHVLVGRLGFNDASGLEVGVRRTRLNNTWHGQRSIEVDSLTNYRGMNADNWIYEKRHVHILHVGSVDWKSIGLEMRLHKHRHIHKGIWTMLGVLIWSRALFALPFIVFLSFHWFIQTMWDNS